METQDCYQGLLSEATESHSDADRADQADQAERAAGIPVTGPIYVEDAHIGDVLSIHVKQIETAGSGVFAVRPETGVPGQDIQKPQVRVLEVNENQVQLDDRLQLPLRPVIGSMGVAAKHGEIETVYPGRHGGNMDTLEITTGSRIYLPVQVNGALLSLGDVKACVGDGQIAGSGVEVEAEVTLRLDTLPGGRFSWPRVESKGEWITITSASTVDQAARLAITEMVKWITQDKGLDFETAYALVSLGGSLRVSQWGNPLTTARMVFPKRVINKLRSVPTASGRLNYRSLPPAANGGAGEETVAADAEQPASRSSRRSGTSRSQRASGRSRQSGSRRGTREKSNGAPSSADGENGRQETPEQQEAASRQETASQQDAAGQQEAVSQQETGSRQEAATGDADEKDGQAAGRRRSSRGGRAGRTGRSGRRKDPASKKDAASDQADASAVAAETVPGSRDDSEAVDKSASVSDNSEKTEKPAAETRKKKTKTATQPSAGDQPEATAEPAGQPAEGKVPRSDDVKSGNGADQKNADQKDAAQKDAAPKRAYGRRQRTVRRA